MARSAPRGLRRRSDAQATRGSGGARAVHVAVDEHLDTERATAPREPIEIDASRNQEAARGRRIDEEIRRLTARAQQLPHLGIIDPEKAL